MIKDTVLNISLEKPHAGCYGGCGRIVKDENPNSIWFIFNNKTYCKQCIDGLCHLRNEIAEKLQKQSIIGTIFSRYGKKQSKEENLQLVNHNIISKCNYDVFKRHDSVTLNAAIRFVVKDMIEKECDIFNKLCSALGNLCTFTGDVYSPSSCIITSTENFFALYKKGCIENNQDNYTYKNDNLRIPMYFNAKIENTIFLGKNFGGLSIENPIDALHDPCYENAKDGFVSIEGIKLCIYPELVTVIKDWEAIQL